MQTIVECVPNFSEGRDAKKVDAIIEALLAGPDVYLLDKEMDADHNRSVITLVGTRESIGEAALRGMGKAAELIDLNIHRGAHPRLGATDVVPFVPVSGVTLEDCVRIAAWVGEEAWRRYKIPTYLYEAAARLPEREKPKHTLRMLLLPEQARRMRVQIQPLEGVDPRSLQRALPRCYGELGSALMDWSLDRMDLASLVLTALAYVAMN